METEVFAGLLTGLDGLETMVCLGCLVFMFIIVNRTVPKVNERETEESKEKEGAGDDSLRDD